MKEVVLGPSLKLVEETIFCCLFSRKTASWTNMGVSGSSVIVAPSKKWYMYDSNTLKVYWLSVFTGEVLAVAPAAPVAQACVKSFTVTSSEKVVLATCSGLYLWKGVWKMFEGGGWVHVRAIDDDFIYAVSEADNQVYQFPVSFGKPFVLQFQNNQLCA